MSYTRTNWIDEVTPLDAEHMNNIEDGIEQALSGNFLGSFSVPSTMYRDILNAAKSLVEATPTAGQEPMYALFQGALIGVKKSNLVYELENYSNGNKAYCTRSTQQGATSWVVKYNAYTVDSGYQSTRDAALKKVYTDLSNLVSANNVDATVSYNILKGRVEYGDADQIFIESLDTSMGYMIGYLQTSEDSFPGAADQGQPNYFMAFYDSAHDVVKILFGVHGTAGAQYHGGASNIGDGLESIRSSLGQLTQVHFNCQGHYCVAFTLAANDFAVLSDDPNFTCKVSKANGVWGRRPLAGPHVLETGALTHKAYSELQDYQVIFCYGYRDALSAPNQFMFAFMPDQLVVGGEDLQFLTMAGSNNWQYPVRVKRESDGQVYWYSGYGYDGNTTFYVTKVLGI